MLLRNTLELAERVHTANEHWWKDPATGATLRRRNNGEMVMLIVSELAEAMEGARKDLMDDKLPHRKMLEVEVADALIRVLDIFGKHARTASSFKDAVKTFSRTVITSAHTGNVGEDLLECVKAVLEIHLPLWHFAINEIPSDGYEAAWNMLWVISMLLEFSRLHHLDLMGAFEDKMAYNATRYDHTNEARLAQGGKRW